MDKFLLRMRCIKKSWYSFWDSQQTLEEFVLWLKAALMAPLSELGEYSFGDAVEGSIRVVLDNSWHKKFCPRKQIEHFDFIVQKEEGVCSEFDGTYLTLQCPDCNAMMTGIDQRRASKFSGYGKMTYREDLFDCWDRLPNGERIVPIFLWILLVIMSFLIGVLVGGIIFS